MAMTKRAATTRQPLPAGFCDIREGENSTVAWNNKQKTRQVGQLQFESGRGFKQAASEANNTNRQEHTQPAGSNDAPLPKQSERRGLFAGCVRSTDQTDQCAAEHHNKCVLHLKAKPRFAYILSQAIASPRCLSVCCTVWQELVRTCEGKSS